MMMMMLMTDGDDGDDDGMIVMVMMAMVVMTMGDAIASDDTREGPDGPTRVGYVTFSSTRLFSSAAPRAVAPLARAFSTFVV